MASPNRGASPLGTQRLECIRVTKQLILPVLSHPSRIRNICILAHVDHGKTTMTDSLIASNGIISFKQAGRLRFLDSREDEQERGITMQASAITLLYDSPTPTPGGAGTVIERHAINLIDSPGHVDFSRQVVTATRLCDGCLILIDVVEGVCTQTLAVLRQARRERLRPCLVLNKMDRLITELCMSTEDAASALRRLVEQVNAVQATISADSDDDHIGASGAAASAEPGAPDAEGEEHHHSDGSCAAFDPLLGNVIFACSTDGWAFSIDHFVKKYSEKLEMKPEALKRCLWGEYFFDPRTKKVLPKKAAEKASLTRTMLAQFVLEPIWATYKASVVELDMARVEKIAAQTSTTLLPRDVKAKDGRAMLKSILGQWMPIAETVFAAIVRHTPSPLEANRIRLASLVRNVHLLRPEEQAVINTLRSPEDVLEEPSVAFVSKLFSITVRPPPSRSSTPQPAAAAAPEDGPDGASAGIEKATGALSLLDASLEDSTEKLIGMARVFHGTFSVGQTVYIIDGKPCSSSDNHNGKVDFERAAGSGHERMAGPHSRCTPFVISELFLLMGREVDAVGKVFAGNIFGIGGIAPYIGKFATLSSTCSCPPLDPPRGEITPIVHVAIRPAQLDRMPDVVAGLKVLCQVDPCAETFLQEENGEHILATAGELHLEQCVKDLYEKFTPPGTELIISPPMVPYRETISSERSINEEQWRAHLGPTDSVSLEDGRFTLRLSSSDQPGGGCTIGARALSIPPALLAFLLENSPKGVEQQRPEEGNDSCFRDKLQAVLEALPSPWSGFSTAMVWAFGPQRNGPNMLLCTIPGKASPPREAQKAAAPFYTPPPLLEPYQASILMGFRFSTGAGPIAHEPMMGVAFVLEEFCTDTEQLPTADPEADGTISRARSEEQCRRQALLGSQLISFSKTLFDLCFLFWSPRLMLAVYSCTVQSTAETLGKVYAVLAKRHGRIICDEYHEGTRFFSIQATLPVEESFGFSEDLRGRTAGVAIPQLAFAGFERLDMDPFWVPSTEDEIEEHGCQGGGGVSENLAMKYLVRIRERKGLFVEKKIVQFAEKQRTLKR